jgi:hypothetical protein
MTRAQRHLHALVWPCLALLIAGLVFAALIERAHIARAAETAEAN